VDEEFVYLGSPVHSTTLRSPDLTSQCHHLCSYAECRQSDLKTRISISTKLKLYDTCILPIFLYGYECRAVTKRDVLKIDAVDRWCLKKLLAIKFYHHVRNYEARCTTKQPHLLTTVQAQRFYLFGHTAQMSDETDAKKALRASPLELWRRPPGCPHTTWMKTIQQDLKSNKLSLNEANRRGLESSTLETDNVSVWCYTLLVVHAKTEAQ